ncbi:PAS domain S-box protein [Parasphingorhabdus litoris]|uniref:histidine kinase n=1 Tax=Parasphingorhabdus litoris TaxID=394733 RepID=A0ABN1A389_9SPHN
MLRALGLDRLERSAYLEAVLSTLPEYIVVIGPDMQMMDVNQAGLDLLGVKQLQDLPSTDPLALISEPYRAGFTKAFNAVMHGKDPSVENSIQVEVRSLDGRLHLQELRFAPMRTPEEEISAVVITARDISELRNTLTAVEKSSAVLESILATIPDPMVVVDEKCRITSFSTAAENLFGYKESEVLGQNVNILMPAPYHEKHDSFVERYLRTGEKRIIGLSRTVEGKKRDGTVFPIRLAIGEAKAGDDHLFTGFIIDLTEAHETEAELQALQTDLAHASRLSAVGTLASALAHEINQPLSAVTNYLSAARDMLDSDLEDSKEQLYEALQESVSECLRAGTIVRRLREFVAKGEMKREILSIAQLVEDATTLGLVGAYDKGVECSINCDPDTNHILADRVQIQQVMINLMRNAIEAMVDSPVKHLNISVHSIPDDMVEISISDTGNGIDPEIAGKIFDPFTSTKGTGMGLGLSICRTIIEAHEGTITAEPNPLGGTIFRITLLKAKEEQPDA